MENKEELIRLFKHHKDIWKNDTKFLSSFTDITEHPSYKAVIDLGKDVIPLLMNDMIENDTFWFHALHVLTRVNPIKDEHRGIIKSMKQDWVEWYSENKQ